MSTINENNIKDIDDNTILENTPMVVIEQGGQTLAIPLMGGDSGGNIEQIQADWAQTDDTAVDFIKNKPEIPTKVTDLSDGSEYAKKTEIPKIETVEGIAAQQIITDDTSTEINIEVTPNTRFVFTQPVTSVRLNLYNTDEFNSNFESEIQFTTSSELSEYNSTIHHINGVLKWVGINFLQPDTSYLVNVKNHIAVVVDYE